MRDKKSGRKLVRKESVCMCVLKEVRVSELRERRGRHQGEVNR